MSIDLDWAKLDSSLSSYLVDALNRQLANTTRPSFIGPVEVLSLNFGSVAPDVELIDLRDIYRDFLEADDDDDSSSSDRGPVKVTEGAEDDDGFEWVSRRAAERLREEPHGRTPSHAYRHLPPHVRTDMFASTPAVQSPREIWSGGMGMSLPSLHDFRPVYGSWPGPGPVYRSPTPATPFSASLPPISGLGDSSQVPSVLGSTPSGEVLSEPALAEEPIGQAPPPPLPPPPPPNPHPNLQLHLHIHWQSDLRITLTTSLLINYPSPMFMSLPIKLSVTGLLFTGEVAVAYEGERRRVHLCILDDQDPYGPAGDRPKRESMSFTPPEMEDDSPLTPGVPPRSAKPLPVGKRLLPSIDIESEIGQTDKHVLKNVTRVERFIQDVIRKTVEEELVFPNFHTLLMGEQ